MSAHEGYVCGRARTTPARQARGTRGSAPPRAGRPRCSAKSRGGTRAHQTQRARSAAPRSKRRCKVYASGRLWGGQSAPGARGLPNGHSLRAQLRKTGRRPLAARAPATVARAASWGVCGLYACMSNGAAECGRRGLRSGSARRACWSARSTCLSGPHILRSLPLPAAAMRPVLGPACNILQEKTFRSAKFFLLGRMAAHGCESHDSYCGIFFDLPRENSVSCEQVM